MLDNAISTGLGTPHSRSAAAPLSPFSTPDAQTADDEDETPALHGHTRGLQAFVQSAASRTVELLRGPDASDSNALRSEVKQWLHDAGRLEALVEEALDAAASEVRSREESAANDRAELRACRRALELHLAQGARDAQLTAERDEAAERAHEEQRALMEAQVAQAHAEVRQLSEQHGRRLREVEREARAASAADVEAALASQAAAARQQAAEVAEALHQRDEALHQLEARSKLVEAAATREEAARQAWADERRGLADAAAVAAAAAADRQEELRAALSESRRQLEAEQLAAAKADARAAAAADRQAAAERAREASDGVWKEKLATVQATVRELEAEAAKRDDLTSLWDEERAQWQRASEAHDTTAGQMSIQLAQSEEERRAMASTLAAREQELASREREMADLAEEVLAQRAEADVALAEASRHRAQLEALTSEERQAAHRSAADSEVRLAQQEKRWLAQAAGWRDEMASMREQLRLGQLEASEAQAEVEVLKREAQAEQRRAATRLAMSEQVGGARAAALHAELERMHHERYQHEEVQQPQPQMAHQHQPRPPRPPQQQWLQQQIEAHSQRAGAVTPPIAPHSATARSTARQHPARAPTPPSISTAAGASRTYARTHTLMADAAAYETLDGGSSPPMGSVHGAALGQPLSTPRALLMAPAMRSGASGRGSATMPRADVRATLVELLDDF